MHGWEKNNRNLQSLIKKNISNDFLIFKFRFTNLDSFIRFQVRVQQNYFFVSEFGKNTEFFRVQVRIRSTVLSSRSANCCNLIVSHPEVYLSHQTIFMIFRKK